MNEVLVSICCQTYNHKNYISQTIESFLMQKTNFRFEILLRDDASTDGTADIVKEYSNKYPDIINPLIYEENQFRKGVKPFADNVKRARGKYIAICEGDDYWTDPFKLQKQVDFLEANQGYSMCFHEVKCFEQNVKKFVGNYSNPPKCTFSTEDLFDRHFIATCSIVYRNEFSFPDFFSQIASGDKLLIFLCSLRGAIHFIDQTMGVYRLHPGGVSNTHYGIKKVFDMSTYLNFINEFTAHKYDQLCKKSLLHEVEVHLLPNYKNVIEHKIILQMQQHPIQISAAFSLKQLILAIFFKIKQRLL